MLKRILILSFIFSIFAPSSRADTGSIIVNGDLNKFYPVIWTDGGWFDHTESILEIGRSNVHEDSQWRGSLMMKVVYHTTDWGNGANFINTDLYSSVTSFVGGWKDATISNGAVTIIIWLRGGGTTYHYHSNYPITNKIYDSIQNPLPFQEENGPSHTYKTVPDVYVNSAGSSIEGTGYFHGGGLNYFAGTVGIGTFNATGYKLAVQGNIHAQSVTVDITNWPDYVLKKDYSLIPLDDLRKYIGQNHHLPEIPSEKEITEKGLNLGDMNRLLMKKVEELTLYLIEKDSRDKEQSAKIVWQQHELEAQDKINQSAETRIKKLEEQLRLLINEK